MGYIKLACPVTHVWYLKRLPSYIANLLDKPLKELEGLVSLRWGDPIESYPNFSFARPITKKPTFLRLRGLFEYEIQSWKYNIPLFFTTREQLVDLDLRIIIENSLVEWKELGEKGHTGNEWEDRKVGRRKDFLVRRVELAKHFIRTNIEPNGWFYMGGKLMSSDINELYRRVIYRNNTLTDLLTTIQEAVDTLLDNGIRGQPMRDGHNKVYKSFRYSLGKRVDYLGRSVIVVGPSLSLHRCGLPREIAIELFQTFVIRGLIRQHLASNIGVAKSKIREKESIVWEILQEVMQGHPVLLNRAPTLHRLGIRAFRPVLVEGRAICLHPLVCKGFNAYFDGDQMAVHVPLSLEAQVEARLLMFSHMNLLSPAIGDPISYQRKICLLDSISDNSYYKYTKEPFFQIPMMQLGLIGEKRINLDSPLWLRWRLDQRVIASRETPIEVHYESLGTFYEIYGHYLIVRSLKKSFLYTFEPLVFHIALYREIEEAIRGFLGPTHMVPNVIL
ncbi:unnamed protein product [Withania somnifera]